MKAVVFLINGERKLGVMCRDDTAVQMLSGECGAAGWGNAELLSLSAEAMAAKLTDIVHPVSAVTLLAPIPRPLRNIFCVGKNYHEHAREFSASGFDSSAAAGTIPKAPIVFTKAPECVTGPSGDVEIDATFSNAIDYEAELAVVISKAGRSIRRAEAMDHVWGYTIINDVTARDVQGRHSQWFLGKSADTFAPLGPCLVSKDEIGKQAMQVRCWVNGELRQDASTADLIFDIPTLIEVLSAGMTLLPGDVIATGTPAGVGIGFQPPRYLRDGDVVKVDISGIGSLQNLVRNRPVQSS